MVDWTQVLIALIVGLPAILSAVFSYLNRRALRTPSGDRIGAIAERTHDLTAADLALTTSVHEKVVNGDSHEKHGPRGDV